MAELHKVYKTSDGRLFEREQRDVARAHDAWLDLLAWVRTMAPLVDNPDGEAYERLACAMAADPGLVEILKRKPAEAPPQE